MPRVVRAKSVFFKFVKKSVRNFVDRLVTSGQVSEGVTKFYEDFRNRRIMVYDAVWVALNQISRKFDGEMNKMIEIWRKSAGAGEE